MDTVHYPFTPLDSPTTEIRLVRFQKDTSIVGYLEQVSFQGSNCPKYIALSYTWGRKRFSREMSINGCAFPILDGLVPFFEVVCENTFLRESWWWIDSICINQGEDEFARKERNAQVDRMSKIYENAAEVMGWLGHGDMDCDDGFRFLQVLLKNQHRLHDRQSAPGLRDLGNNLGDPKKWASLEKIFLLPWWTRVWTLQEYIVARKFTFRYGKRTIDREGVIRIVSLLDNWLKSVPDETLVSSRAFQAAWVRIRMLHLYRGKFTMSLLALMAYCGNSNASDPRDRIYSMLGLATDGFMIGPPTYQHDFQRVYVNLVKTYIQHYNNLDIICFAGLFNQHAIEPTHSAILPTWLPDWRVITMPSVMPLMVSQSSIAHVGNLRAPNAIKPTGPTRSYCAGQSKNTFQAQFSANLRVLTCQGVMIDHIDGIGGLKIDHGDKEEMEHSWNQVCECVSSTSAINNPAIFHLKKTCQLNPHEASKLLKYICRSLLLDRKDRYLTYEAPPGYLLEEFIPLCIAARETPTSEELHPRFLDWYQRNRNLCIQGYTFEEICLAASKPRNAKNICLSDMLNIQSFLSRFTDTTKWMSRRLMTTNTGEVGMASFRAQKGDQIWVLLGCNVPVILRKSVDLGSFTFVGECFLHQYMQGPTEEDLCSDVSKLESVCLV